MKKIVLICIVFIAVSISVNAQNYITGIGIRSGFTNGVTVKHFINSNQALEGIIATRWSGILITGLFEFDNDFDTPGLTWYYGAGAHVGIWNDVHHATWWVEGESTSPVIGVDGVLGIEYTFENFPVSLSLDWKPAINIIGYTGAWADSGAFSVRYVF